MSGYYTVPMMPMDQGSLDRLWREWSQMLTRSKFELDDSAAGTHKILNGELEKIRDKHIADLRAIARELQSTRPERASDILKGIDDALSSSTEFYGASLNLLACSFVARLAERTARLESGTFNEAASLTALAQWHGCGRPTFRLEDSITAALMTTEVDRTAALNLPFPSFLIQFPRDFLKVLPNAGGEAIAANRVLVSRIDSIGTDSARVGSDGRRTVTNDDLIRNAKVGHHLVVKLFGSFRPLQHDIYRCAPFGSPASAISELVLTPWNDDQLAASDSENMGMAWRLAFNVIQYVNSVHSSSLPGTRSDNRANIALERIAPKRWLLGGQMKISSDLIAAAKAHGTGAPGWRLKHQFVVRGHWRQQAVGIARADRKTIWIEPFWKGPKATETGLLRAFHVDGQQGWTP